MTLPKENEDNSLPERAYGTTQPLRLVPAFARGFRGEVANVASAARDQPSNNSPTSPDSTGQASTFDELLELPRGRGMLANDVAHRIGPGLRAACGLAANDSPTHVRDKVSARLTELCAELPDDLRVSVAAALGLHPAAKHQFMQDRMQWAAHQINRDHPRAAIRRMKVGFRILAEQLDDSQEDVERISPSGETLTHIVKTQVAASTCEDELLELPRGRGMRAAEIAERIGPGLRVVCEVAAADPPATVRRKVATRLTDLSAELSDDLRVSVLAALGLHPAAKHQFMQDRMHWAAHQINRDHPGAAIRRMRVGFGLLARQLAVDPKADQGWWPPLSPAVQVAQQARTKEEFGAALDLLRRSRGLSLNTLGRRLADARQWIGKSTLSRACSGRTLFRDREKIAAFVNACGVEHEIEVWEKAWERASEHARQDKSADPHTAQVCGAGLYANTSAGATPPDSDVVDLNTLGAGGPGELLPSGAGASGDDVVGEVCVRFSRRHLRTAVVLLAASAPTTAGLTVSAGSNTETVVLAIATGLALYEYVQTLSDPSLGAAPSGA